MSENGSPRLNRRLFLGSGAAALGGLATPAIAQVTTSEIDEPIETARRNISSFRTLDWQPYFSSLKGRAILVDIASRVHFWSADGRLRLYPSSVPLSEDLTRRGGHRSCARLRGQAGHHPCNERAQPRMA